MTKLLPRLAIPLTCLALLACHDVDIGGDTPKDAADAASQGGFNADPQSALDTQASSTPLLTAGPTALSFGELNVGTKSTPATLTITNAGQGPSGQLTLVVNADIKAFAVVSSNCDGALAMGASCSFGVSFSPTQIGDVTGTVTVTDGTVSVVVLLSGKGTASPGGKPYLGVIGGVSFGQVAVGQGPVQEKVQVTNKGDGVSGTLVTTMASGSDAFKLVGSTCTGTLAPGESCSFDVSFTPTATGDFMSTVIVTDGFSASTVTLAGTGISLPASTPLLTVNAAAYSFSAQLGESISFTLTITNVGTGVSGTLTTSLKNKSPALELSPDTCNGNQLLPRASCQIGVVFSPTVTGDDTDTLIVTDGTSSVKGELMGTASEPDLSNAVLSVSPATLDFGTVKVSSTGLSTKVTVVNAGSASSGTLTISSSSKEIVIEANSCTAPLSAGASCTFEVKFVPQLGGAWKGTIQVTDGTSTIAVHAAGIGGS